jgi:hypothetical protein
MSVRVGASEKAKGTSEGFLVKCSITDRRSEKHKEDIMRWEGGRAFEPETLIEWQRLAMEKIEWRMEDLGRWARKGSKGLRSS